MILLALFKMWFWGVILLVIPGIFQDIYNYFKMYIFVDLTRYIMVFSTIN